MELDINEEKWKKHPRSRLPPRLQSLPKEESLRRQITTHEKQTLSHHVT